MTNRYAVKIVGESGQGVNSVGEILAKSLKDTGFYIFGYREYPSLIKGGYASYQIDIAETMINASFVKTNVLMCLSRVSFRKYLKTVGVDGVVLHNIFKLTLTEQEQEFVEKNRVSINYIPAGDLAVELGGKKVMANTVMLGALWQLLSLDITKLIKRVKQTFVKKPEVIELNLKCLHVGYGLELLEKSSSSFTLVKKKHLTDDLLLTGNQAIGLGAVASGVRVFYAYPMTPSSSILTYLSSIYHQTGMLVKQIEDEISVANMAVGSMHAGARTLIATSGGGFDLMTETVSLAGITETPFVCVIAQRPGPGTGLPTWSSASDLNIAVYAGHGEYPRCVLSAHDASSCYSLTQKALNIAERYQIPVILLTEKQIAESIFQLDKLPKDEEIERHILSDKQLQTIVSDDRYKNTDTGISPRWIPGSCSAVYDANSDEHSGNGSSIEDAKPAKASYQKRLKKEQALLKDLPEPELFGSKKFEILFVGWGSVKNTMLDVFEQLGKSNRMAYLHYEYLYPVKTKQLLSLSKKAKKLVLVENNATGQLGSLLTSKVGKIFDDKLLKMDGRPFFLEDIFEYIKREVKL